MRAIGIDSFLEALEESMTPGALLGVPSPTAYDWGRLLAAGTAARAGEAQRGGRHGAPRRGAVARGNGERDRAVGRGAGGTSRIRKTTRCLTVEAVGSRALDSNFSDRIENVASFAPNFFLSRRSGPPVFVTGGCLDERIMCERVEA